MDRKTWGELSHAELVQRAKLTPQEQTAVDAFIAAARGLQKSLFIELDDAQLTVFKRTTRGSGREVAAIRKKSLEF